jgi:hypothetical protein
MRFAVWPQPHPDTNDEKQILRYAYPAPRGPRRAPLSVTILQGWVEIWGFPPFCQEEGKSMGHGK